MTTVIIAAHDEQQVLGACLDALIAQSGSGTLQIIVSANGCSDNTAGLARSRGVTVVDRAEPGKTEALNAAERVAVGFPRVYLDADIVVPPVGLERLVGALDDGVLAAAPRRILDTQGSSLLVRAYCAINERLPVFRDALFGRGMIVLSAEGRARFDRFPDIIADDLFLDGLFVRGERRVVEDVSIVVRAPRTTSALLRRLIRVRHGNAEVRAAAARGIIAASVRPAQRWSWLRDVVLPKPWLILAAVPYVAITVAAAIACRTAPDVSWGRDSTTRSSSPALEGPWQGADSRV